MAKFSLLDIENPLGRREETGGEIFETLVEKTGFRLLRIVSTGQATPPGEWYDQGDDEWVVVIAGSAGLRVEDDPETTTLGPGEGVHLPAHKRHRVEWTDPDRPTVWLALHFDA